MYICLQFKIPEQMNWIKIFCPAFGGIIACILTLATPSSAQDKILFLSGKVMACKVVEIDSADVKIEKTKKNKSKIVLVGKDRVFAVRYGDGKTEILYEPDSSEADDFSIREMEFYVTGAQDALESYKAPLFLAGGFVLGATSMVILGPFYGLIPIIPFVFIASMSNPKIKNEDVSNPDLLREDIYIMGFRNKAKNIKIQNVIIGSLAGYVSGFGALLLIP